MKIKSNENGQALIAVMVLSVFFTTLFFGFQVYWNSRVHRLYTIREAYNLMDATEKAARDVRNAWDLSAAQLTTATVTPTATAIKNNMTLTLDPTCLGGCAANAVLCYANPNNSNVPYCFYGTKSTTASLDFRLVIPEEEKISTVERSVVRIFKFFKGESLFENKAVAFSALPIPVRTDIVGAGVACPGSPSCMHCDTVANASANTANIGVCSTIYSCPQDFKSCAKYVGGALSTSPGGGPIFFQQFYLPLVGNQN